MLEAGRRSVTLAEMTSARGRALPAACEGAEVGTVSLTPVNSAHGRFDRRQSSVRPRPLLQPSLAAAAARAVAAAATRAVAGPPDTPPLSAALSHCCSTHGMLKARPVCRARTHRRAREIWCLGRVWHTLSSAHDRPFRQPAPAAIAALTGPCLAQNTTTPKTRQRRAARARRAALAVTRPRCQHRSSSHASCAAPCPPQSLVPEGSGERDDEGRHLN